MAVAGGDLLAGDDQQVGPGVVAPDAVRGGGVVVGGDHEVQPGRPRTGGHLLGKAVAVRVDGVQVAVAPVPGPAPATGPVGRVGRGEVRSRVAEAQGDLDAVVETVRRHLVRPEHHVPGAPPDRPRQVAGRRLRPADREGGAEAARPAPEAPAAEVGAALVEDADVTGVGLGAGRHRGFAVAVRDRDLPYAVGHFDREVHEVGGACGEMAGNGAGDIGGGRGLGRGFGLGLGRGCGEGERGEGHGRAEHRARSQQIATGRQ